jgi:hypothetical protein
VPFDKRKINSRIIAQPPIEIRQANVCNISRRAQSQMSYNWAELHPKVPTGVNKFMVYVTSPYGDSRLAGKGITWFYGTQQSVLYSLKSPLYSILSQLNSLSEYYLASRPRFLESSLRFKFSNWNAALMSHCGILWTRRKLSGSMECSLLPTNMHYLSLPTRLLWIN